MRAGAEKALIERRGRVRGVRVEEVRRERALRWWREEREWELGGERRDRVAIGGWWVAVVKWEVVVLLCIL